MLGQPKWLRSEMWHPKKLRKVTLKLRGPGLGASYAKLGKSYAISLESYVLGSKSYVLRNSAHRGRTPELRKVTLDRNLWWLGFLLPNVYY